MHIFFNSLCTKSLHGFYEAYLILYLCFDSFIETTITDFERIRVTDSVESGSRGSQESKGTIGCS